MIRSAIEQHHEWRKGMKVWSFVLGLLSFCIIGAFATAASAAVIQGSAAMLRIEGKCLGLPDEQTVRGTRVTISDCLEENRQLWNVGTDGTIRPINDTSKCLDLPGWQTANGTPIQIWDCNGGTNQQWTLGSNGQLVGFGGKCVDNPGWQTANGTPFQYFSCNGGTNQYFMLDDQRHDITRMAQYCLDRVSRFPYRSFDFHSSLVDPAIQEFNSVFDLGGINFATDSLGNNIAFGNFTTDIADFTSLNGDGSQFCERWNWVHVIDATAAPNMNFTPLPDVDTGVGLHFDGSQDVDPVSECNHSTVTYLVFGRRLGHFEFLGGGVKYGLGEDPGPCGDSYSAANDPCNGSGMNCGSDSVFISDPAVQELWIGMVSWSHDHNHFFGGDPRTNFWWDSRLSYGLAGF